MAICVNLRDLRFLRGRVIGVAMPLDLPRFGGHLEKPGY